MFGTYYYHEKIRKAVSIFGRLFNNLYVVRLDSNGTVLNQQKVPLAYAPRQKYLDRIRTNPDLLENSQVALKLPRMSFEITSIAYDNTRQLTKVSNFKALGLSSNDRQKFYSPVPYEIGFQLNIMAKNQDDALQLVEQILPTFNPQYTLTIKPFSTEYPNFTEDIPIIIQGVSFSDDFDGDLSTRRTIIYTLDFQMKVSFYGNISSGGIIRSSIADVFLMDQGAGQDSDVKIETITVTPNPTATIGLDDSDFGFTTDIDLTYDSGLS
tara:strand:- start:1913 stop:2713 length:801 start_codon:yes stop_codon:yes gene_type:complete